MPPRIKPLIQECDFLIEYARTLIVVRGPILNIGPGANDIEISGHNGSQDVRRTCFGLGKKLPHAPTNARKMSHLRVLLGGVFFARVEVGRNYADEPRLGFNHCF